MFACNISASTDLIVPSYDVKQLSVIPTYHLFTLI